MFNKITSKPVLRVSEIKNFLFFSEARFKYPKGYRQAEWFFGGAHAIATVCEKVSKEKKGEIIVALPGFFCGQTIRFLRSMSIKLVFYQLGDALTPDFKNLEEQISADGIDVFVLVHYFGAVKAQQDSKSFADSYNAIFLEDAAHVMSYADNHWQGDYIILCPHKHFVSPPVALLIHKDSRKLRYGGALKFANFPIFWMTKQLIRALFRQKVAPWGRVWNSDSEKIDAMLPSRHAINRAIYNLENYKSDRRLKKHNAMSLYDGLSKVDGWTPFQVASVSETPYLLAMICDDRNIARRRYGLLNARYPIVVQWPDLPCEINENEIVREQVTDLRDRVLYFPIHSQLDLDSWLQEITQIVNGKGF